MRAGLSFCASVRGAMCAASRVCTLRLARPSPVLDRMCGAALLSCLTHVFYHLVVVLHVTVAPTVATVEFAVSEDSSYAVLDFLPFITYEDPKTWLYLFVEDPTSGVLFSSENVVIPNNTATSVGTVRVLYT